MRVAVVGEKLVSFASFSRPSMSSLLTVHDSFRSVSFDPSGRMGVLSGNKSKPSLWEVDSFPVDVSAVYVC